MRSITAVEIGADTCALATTQVRREELRVTAAETLDPAAFPGIDAFILALQQVRKLHRFPRRCRAVVWGLPDGATRKDAAVQPLVEPLVRAGFKIARVVTPCNALGALARLRTSRSGGAMCWLGINRDGVAIVVIRPGKLLYSHSFAWDSSVGASGSQARLLQRYSLVAFLTPEVRRALAAAKQKGTTVDGIVTCGNLPDLRALTMPLIEELDIEVETLDSLEGLVVKPEIADRLADLAPAIRLACAGAFARETRSIDEAKRRRMRRGVRLTSVLRVAAAVLALAAGGYVWYLSSRAPLAKPIVVTKQTPGSGVRGPTSGVRPPVPAPANTAAAKSAPPATPPTSNPSAATQPAAPSSALRPPTSARATVGKPSSATVTPPPANATAKNAPPVTPPPLVTKPSAPVTPPLSATPKSNATGASRPAAPTSVPGSPSSTPANAAAKVPPSTIAKNAPPLTPPPPVTKPSVPVTPAKSSPPASSQPVTPDLGRRTPDVGSRPLAPQPRPADKPDATPGARTTGKPLPEPLKDPVPRVTAILMTADRRLATIGDEGQIIAVGDTIGRRVVVSIDERTVLLREPSGVLIRVALGGRVVAIERGGG